MRSFVDSIDRADGASKLTLSDGSIVTADVVVVALGNRPATGWLAGFGLTIEDGVVCDGRLTGAPGVWSPVTSRGSVTGVPGSRPVRALDAGR